MKTAISVPDNIFKEAERAAREFQCSRSQFYTLAAKEFLKKVKTRKLFESLNKAYAADETDEEVLLRQRSKKYYGRNIAKDEF